ncbi:MAG: glycosyltransferase [Planctomycetota bacterium]|jgi:glycosyltransferase involved in cell wall biosynthesis/predicted  nucleic acid-binding Zn-ribbon protein
MRIALLSYEYPPETDGESELGSHAFMRAKGLASLGHEIHVFAGSPEPGWRSVRDGAISVTRFHHSGALQRLGGRAAELGLGQVGERLAMSADTVGALRRALREGSFDLIETDSVSGEAALLGPLRDLPIVVRVHDLLGLRTGSSTGSMDRHLAACLERLSIDAAMAISTSSSWVLEELQRRQVAEETQTVDLVAEHGLPLKKVRIYCPSLPRSSAASQVLIEVLVQILEDYESTHLVIPIRRGREKAWSSLEARLVEAGKQDRVCRLQDADELLRRSAISQTDAFIRYADPGEGMPFELLEAMALGASIVCGRSPGIAELLRPELDAIICDQASMEPGRQALQRLVEQGVLRERLSKSARDRCAKRFDLETVARQSESFYHYALQRRSPTQIKVTRGATLPLGPDNWFHAWWLERSTRTPPSMALDGEGVPLFAQVPLDALRFVETILNRSWCLGPAEWQAPEWGFLKDLKAKLLELALHRRYLSPGELEEFNGRLSLPPLSHPLFESEQAAVFIDEFWRLERLPGVDGWLRREVTSAWFAEAAVHRPVLRRLLVEALIRCPSREVYAVAREIYRGPGIHQLVIAEDQEFFASGPAGERFAERIEKLGLHAPLERAPFLEPGGPSTRSIEASGSAAKVTVIIPSYQHEAFIEDAIQSVLAQTREDFDLLVVDDGSKDRTVELARAIEDPRLEVRVNEKNLGLGASVQAALEALSTPYVALLNSDDLFHPRRLELALEKLAAEKKTSLVASGLQFIDRDGRLLEQSNSCVVEVGPQTHSWLEWFALISKELDKPEDWISLKTLIRHNVLATSSNMVLRTAWMKKQMPAASSLKYCLDWQLFMLAAMEERLGFLPEPLMAYRFHDSNTVWFSEGGRGDYILEVNRVIATVLRALASRRKKSQGLEAAMAELSGLLQEDVIQHGETDGLAMYLVELARGLNKTADALDPENPAIDELVEGAIQRNTLAQVAGRLDTDPWELIGLSQSSERFRIESHVADEYLERARQLDGEIGRLRHELDDMYRRAEDVKQTEEAFEQERLNMRAELVRVREEMFSLFKRKDELEAERAELAESHEQLAESHEQLAQTKEEIAQSRDELERQKDELVQTGRSLENELDSVQRVLTDAHRRGVALQEELELANLVREQSVDALEVVERDLREAQSRFCKLRGERDRELDSRQSDPHARFSRLFLDKLRLLGFWKTLLRLRQILREPTWRSLSHLGRRLSEAGRKRQRVMILTAGRFPHSRANAQALEAAALLAGGFDARLLSFLYGDRSELGAECSALIGHMRVLEDDTWLYRRDRTYFAGRKAEAIASLEKLPHAPHMLPRALRYARTAKVLGAGISLVHSLDETAFHAYAAQQLTGLRYALVLGDGSLAEPTLTTELLEPIFASATLIAVDSQSTGNQILEQQAWTSHDGMHVRPPFAFQRGQETNNAELRMAIFGVFGSQDLASVAEAVKILRGEGMNPQVDVLGEPEPRPRALHVWDDLWAGLRRLGLQDNFHFHGASRLDRQAELLSGAAVLIESRTIRRELGQRPGIPRSISAALGASIPVIATRCEALASLGEEGIVLVDPGSAQAIADAYLKLNKDLDLRSRRVEAGKLLFAERLSVEAANRDWHAALRKTLGMA